MVRIGGINTIPVRTLFGEVRARFNDHARLVVLAERCDYGDPKSQLVKEYQSRSCTLLRLRDYTFPGAPDPAIEPIRKRVGIAAQDIEPLEYAVEFARLKAPAELRA